jgi:hypothetical protein
MPAPKFKRKLRLTGIITKKTNDAPRANIAMDIAEYVVTNSQKRCGTKGLSIVSAPTISTGNAANCPPFIDKLRVDPNMSWGAVKTGRPSKGDSISSAGASRKANTSGCHQKVAPAPILHARMHRNTVFLNR